MTRRAARALAGERPLAIGGSELLRVRFLFLLLGGVPVFLAGWLGVLQVAHAGHLTWGKDRAPQRAGPALMERQRDRSEQLPSARGTVLDRHGSTLAIDCEAYEVRAEVRLPANRGSRAQAIDYLQGLAGDLADRLTRDPELTDKARFRREQRQRIFGRLMAAFGLDALPATAVLTRGLVPASTNVLVTTRVASGEAATGLRDLDDRNDYLFLHWLHKHERIHPDRESTWGLVGFESSLPVIGADGARTFERHGVFGIERLRALDPRAGGARGYFIDARHVAFWTGPGTSPERPCVLHTTLDLELQKLAVRLLREQALVGAREGQVRVPKWGALVLVEVPSGDLLAAATFHRDVEHEQAAAFTPHQSLYEPGSIVKPLVFAWALQFGGLDWHRVFDCSSNGKDFVVVKETGRRVRDDHACGQLAPHGILVNSSNIGAVKVGSMLRREQWQEWFRFYGLDRSLELELQHERIGKPHKDSFDPAVPLSQFRRWSLSSFSTGYEMQVNALQMARAYLSLLAGSQRGLRLYRGVEVDGVRFDAPPAAAGPRMFSPAVVDLLTMAMTDVVSSDPVATGRHLHALLMKEEGIDAHGLIGGKTGTSVSRVGTKTGSVEMRNASFVGFAPAARPRYLAVCVLQKDDSARFYGGSYAAPPVGRLLLQALRLEERRRLRQEPQVSVSPGDQAGAGRAPETTSDGR